MKGPEQTLKRHGHEDLPQKASALQVEVELLRSREAGASSVGDTMGANEREQFEAWRDAGELGLTPVLERDGELYDNLDVQRAWRGWEARALLTAARADLAADANEPNARCVVTTFHPNRAYAEVNYAERTPPRPTAPTP